MFKKLLQSWGIATPSSKTRLELKNTKTNVETEINAVERQLREVNAAINRQRTDRQYLEKELDKLTAQRDSISKMLE